MKRPRLPLTCFMRASEWVHCAGLARGPLQPEEPARNWPGAVADNNWRRMAPESPSLTNAAQGVRRARGASLAAVVA